MKRLAVLIVMLLLAVPAMAAGDGDGRSFSATSDCEYFSGSCNSYNYIDGYEGENDRDTEAGIGIEAPNLIGFGGDWFFGPALDWDINNDEVAVYGRFKWAGTALQLGE